MNYVSPRRLAAAIAAVAVVLIPAGLAWACMAVVSLTLTPSSVQPGGTLTVTGREFAAKAPILIHLDSATGPVLATVPGPSTTMTSVFTVMVTVPSDISTGPHLLLAQQDHHDMNSGQPARAVFYVGASGPAAAAAAARPLTLATSTGPSGSSLVVIGLAVAGAALLVAGLGIFLASRGGARRDSKVVAS